MLPRILLILGISSVIKSIIVDYDGYRFPSTDYCKVSPFWENAHECESIALDSIASAQEFYENYIVPRKPVVIKAGSFDKLGWNMSAWELEELKNRVGDLPVVTEHLANSDVPFGSQSRKKAMWLRNFIDGVSLYKKGRPLMYLNIQAPSNRVLSPPLSSLTSAFNLPQFFMQLPLSKANIWMGNAGPSGASSELHFDAPDNLYCLLKGRKKFMLYAPSDVPFLYMNNNVYKVESDGYIRMNRTALSNGKEAHFSAVNPLRPDLKTFPLFAGATPASCTLEAGDMLYLPGGWFHHVTSYDLNLAINFWANYVPDRRNK